MTPRKENHISQHDAITAGPQVVGTAHAMRDGLIGVVRAHPCKERKDGATSLLVLLTRVSFEL